MNKPNIKEDFKEYIKSPDILNKYNNIEVLDEYVISIIIRNTPLPFLTTPLNNGKTIISTFIDWLYTIKDKSLFNTRKYDIINELYARNYLTSEVTKEFIKRNIYIQSEQYNFELELDHSLLSDKPDIDSLLVKTSPEFQELVKRFYDTFCNENNKVVCDDIVYSQLLYYMEDHNRAYNNLDIFFEAKKMNKDFSIITSDTTKSTFTALFSENKPISLKINKYCNKEELDHEIGHLLHYVYDNFMCPDSIINSFPYISSPETEKKAKEIAIELNTRAIELEVDTFYDNYIEKTYGSKENYIKHLEEYFEEYYGTIKIVQEAVEGNYFDSDILNALVEATNNINANPNKEKLKAEYIKSRIENEHQYFKRKENRITNEFFLLIENFLDAYYGGYISNYIKNMDNYCEGLTSFHSKEYFSDINSRKFKEVLANYIAIIQSPYKDECITELLKYIPDAFLNNVAEYYSQLQKPIYFEEVFNVKSQ